MPAARWTSGRPVTTRDWRVDEDESALGVIEAYREAIAAADAVIANLRLDDVPARAEPWWSDAGLSFPDLRTVLVHHLVETATHAGQLDAVREVLDGKQYLVL